MDATSKHNRSLPDTNKTKSRLTRTIHRVISLKAATNVIGICVLPTSSPRPHPPDDDDDDAASSVICSKRFDKAAQVAREQRRRNQHLVLEALIAKLFAEVTAIKAAYAELQMAQRPYRGDAIQAADQAVVDSLKQLSELKHKFHRKEVVDQFSSPQVTIMLAEIQEQQSLMKTYEITIRKLEAESYAKSSSLSSLKGQLRTAILANKGLEARVSSSGAVSMLDGVSLGELGVGHFIQFLHYTVTSARSFVKLMVREMDSANWDIATAVNAVDPDTNTKRLSDTSHSCFVFESYVCKIMLQGFDHPNFGGVPDSSQRFSRDCYFGKFKKTTSISSLKQFLGTQKGSSSSFASFLRGKYLNLVHAKMECCSFFGNLSQRKMISGGGANVGFPESCFFFGFAEMAMRVWCLNLLAFSLGLGEVEVFQVRKGCRFSEVFMECVTGDQTVGGCGDGEMKVAFTVVPGFKLGRNLVQYQVYLLPPPAARLVLDIFFPGVFCIYFFIYICFLDFFCIIYFFCIKFLATIRQRKEKEIK